MHWSKEPNRWLLQIDRIQDSPHVSLNVVQGTCHSLWCSAAAHKHREQVRFEIMTVCVQPCPAHLEGGDISHIQPMLNNLSHFDQNNLSHPITVIDEMQKSPIEKRKRNLKTISPHSRGEREIWIPFHQFREEKEKSESLCLVSRGEREISNFLAQVREEKEKPEFISPVSRGEREISNSFAQFREEKEKLANISNFREEKFKTKFLNGYIHLQE